MPPLGSKEYEGVNLPIFNSHSAADGAFNDLAKNLSFTKNDPGYKNKVSPLLSNIERLYPEKYKANIAETKNLIKLFMDTGMNKETFKDRWRAIQPGTDEHFSTESVFTTLDTLRDRKKSIDMEVVKDVFAVVSLFRLPTEQTGHATLKPNGSANPEEVMAHPRGDKQSLYIDTGRNPKHWTFDMVRRTSSLLAGEAHNRRNPGDGAGVIMAMLGDSVRTSMHNVGSSYAKDVHISSLITPDVKESAFVGREQIKRLYNRLFGITNAGTQAKDNKQYNGLSPAARSVETGPDGKLRTRSISPMRTDNASESTSTTAISGNKRLRSSSTLRGTNIAEDPAASSSSTASLKKAKRPGPPTPIERI